MSSARRNLLAGSVCFVFFLLFYGITSRGKLQTSDEAAVFVTGVSLATRGHLAIDEFASLNERVNIGQCGPDGHFYTKYFPGNAFSVACIYKLTAQPNDKPYVWVEEAAPSITGARWAMRINALWGALGLTALLFLTRRYFDRRTAIATVLLVGLCSDWWYQSRGLFSEVGAGAFLISCLYMSILQKPYGTAAALAVSILFRPTNLLALPIWAKTVWRRIPHALGSGLIIAAAGLLLALYNWARFGSPLTFGYPEGNLSVPFFKGLFNMFVSPGRSLFVYSPVLLLALPGAYLFYKREKILALLCLITVLSYAAVVASWGPLGWGLTWGMRLMTPIVPILGFLIAPTLDFIFSKRKWLVSVVSLLAVLGFAVQVLALMRDPTHVLIDRVGSGEVKFEDTIYSVRDSWPALQIRMLSRWQPCDVDSYTVRHWFTSCPD